MALDPRLEALRAHLPQEKDRSLPVAERRAAIQAGGAAAFAFVMTPGPDKLDERDVDADGVPVRVYRPRDGVLPVLLWMHGGGWWLGTLDENDAGCRRRALAGDCVVVSVDYRLAPEHPFPAALDDSETALRWLAAHADELGVDASRVVVGGASAGGNLAAALALRTDVPLAGQLLEIPGVAPVDMSFASRVEFAEGYGLSAEDIAERVAFYAGSADRRDPFLTPLTASDAQLATTPPALVVTCECDVLRDEGQAYADRLAGAGVPTTYRLMEGQAHGSCEMDALMPDVTADYLGEIGRFLRQRFS